MDIETLVREADPVRNAEPVLVQSEGAQALLRQIMGGQPQEGVPNGSPSAPTGGFRGPGSVDTQHHRPGRSRMWLVAAAAAIVVLAGVGVVTLARGPGHGAHRTATAVKPVPMDWRLVSSVGPRIQAFEPSGRNPQGLHGLVCPTTRVCYLIASTFSVLPPNAVYRSTDGGATWTPLALPPGVFLDTPISCVSTLDCLVGAEAGLGSAVGASNVAQLLLSTNNGGASWTTHQVPMPPVEGTDSSLDQAMAGLQGALDDLDCFSASSCIAFGTTPTGQPEGGSNGTSFISLTVAMRTDDAGATWSTYVFPWSATPSGAPGWSDEEVAAMTADRRRSLGAD